MAITSSLRIRTRVARKSNRGTPRSVLLAVEIGTPLVLIILWWVASAGSSNPFFPPLETILHTLGELATTSRFWLDVGSSVGNLVLSFAIAVVLGVAAGIALGLSEKLSWFVEPTMHFFRAIPPVALVPIFVSLLGFGNETRILSITLAAIFPVLISTIDGVRGYEPTLRMVSQVYRFGVFDRLFGVVLPAAAPRILAGMQVSLIVAFVVMVASEMMVSSTALGAATLVAHQSFMIPEMWAGVLVLGVLGYAFTALFNIFRRWVLRWYIASQQQEKNL